MKRIFLMAVAICATMVSFAQDSDARYIEIEGKGTKMLSPDMITAELSIYSYSFDYGDKKDEQKFEGMVQKMFGDLNADDFAVNQEDLNTSCGSDYEKYIDLEFSSYEDYVKMEEKVYDMSNDDIYVDLYLDNYKVSEERKTEAFEELFGDALQNAVDKADIVAEKFGVTVGEPIMVVERDDYYDYYYDDYYYDDYSSMEQIELEKTVMVRFELK